MKNLSDKLIISLQVAGFLASVAMLFFLHNKAQALFAIAFAVHFAGDLMRFLKDGL